MSDDSAEMLFQSFLQEAVKVWFAVHHVSLLCLKRTGENMKLNKLGMRKLESQNSWHLETRDWSYILANTRLKKQKIWQVWIPGSRKYMIEAIFWPTPDLKNRRFDRSGFLAPGNTWLKPYSGQHQTWKNKTFDRFGFLAPGNTWLKLNSGQHQT